LGAPWSLFAHGAPRVTGNRGVGWLVVVNDER
jgi:hypothetical protein